MSVRISVVVAAKNSGPDLRRFLADFRATAPEQASLVIVDGGSTDGTSEWLQEIAPRGESRGVRWISQSDDGIAQAWNRGVALADGDWILFLGCDDHFGDPSAWRDARDILAMLPDECGVAAFPVEIVSPGGAVIDTVSPRAGESLLAVNTIPHQGCFHRRGLWARLGPFDGDFPVACDYEFLLRAAGAGVGVRVFQGAAPVRMQFGGASKRHPLRNLREFRAAQIRHGVRRFRLAWWAAWARAAVRCCLGTAFGDGVAAQAADWGRRLRGLPSVWTVR